MQWKESKKKLNQDKYQIYQIEDSINSEMIKYTDYKFLLARVRVRVKTAEHCS